MVAVGEDLASADVEVEGDVDAGGQGLNWEESVQARWPDRTEARGRGFVDVAGAGSGSVHALLDADAAVALRLDVRLAVVLVVMTIWDTTAEKRAPFYPRIAWRASVSLQKSRREMVFLHNGGCLTS